MQRYQIDLFLENYIGAWVVQKWIAVDCRNVDIDENPEIYPSASGARKGGAAVAAVEAVEFGGSLLCEFSGCFNPNDFRVELFNLKIEHCACQKSKSRCDCFFLIKIHQSREVIVLCPHEVLYLPVTCVWLFRLEDASTSPHQVILLPFWTQQVCKNIPINFFYIF